MKNIIVGHWPIAKHDCVHHDLGD